MRILKKDTAYSLVILMVGSADHVTGLASLTLTITASKAGAAFGSITPTVTDLGSGWYKLALTTSHTDTLGDLALHITGTAADPTDVAMQVSANILGDTLPANATQLNGTSIAGTGTRVADGFVTLLNVATPVLTLASVNQTGDSFALIGSTGSGLTSLAPSATALSTAQWTNARSAYLDNLNVGGAVASQADISALNQSASRRVLLATVGQYEINDEGTITYTIEARTFDGDGASVNADTEPTLTATGNTSGDLSANLSAATNPAIGLYRWAYSVLTSAAVEEIRMDLSATISASVFTISAFTQVCNFVSATWTTADATRLQSVFDKTEFLPSATAGTAGGLLIAGANAASSFATLTVDGTATFNAFTVTLAAAFGTFSIAGANNIAQTGNSFTRLGAPAGASVSADIAALTSGGTDWTANERTAIKAILGVPASGTTPATPTTGILAAIAAKTILITSGNVSVVSPVGPTGATITLYRGDDYFEEDAGSIPFVATGVPSLIGATVLLKSSALTESIEGEVVDATHLYFEIPKAQTDTMCDADFEVEVTLANGHVRTIADGKITMKGQL